MANKLQDDPNCIALWRFEDASGAQTMGLDSIGGNDCTVPASNQDTADFKEGSASSNFPGNQNCTSSDSNLDPGFPGRYADASPHKIFSAVGWFKMDTYPAAGQHRALWGKYLYRSADDRSYLWTIKETGGSYYLTFLKGYSSGTAEESTQLTSVSIQTGQWYHLGATYDDTTGAVRLRLWDPSTSSVYETTDTHSQSLAVLNIAWAVGGYGYPSGWNGINPFDGRQDEIAVFTDILTPEEIDLIRQGVYLAGTVREAAGAVSARSAVSVPSSGLRVNPQRAAGVISARSRITLAHYQYKSHAFVPAQVLAEPYPVPMLWQYLQAGVPLEVGLSQWAERLSQWSEEHITRIMRDVAKLGQEKTTDWVEV